MLEWALKRYGWYFNEIKLILTFLFLHKFSLEYNIYNLEF